MAHLLRMGFFCNLNYIQLYTIIAKHWTLSNPNHTAMIGCLESRDFVTILCLSPAEKYRIPIPGETKNTTNQSTLPVYSKAHLMLLLQLLSRQKRLTPLSMRPQAPWMNHAGFFPKASWLTFSKWSCNLDTMLIYVIGPPHPHMLTIWMIRVWGGWLNWVMSSASLVIKHHPGVEFHPRWILYTTRSQVKCDHMWQEKHSLQMMEDYFVFYSKQLLSSKTSVAELLVCESFWNKITKTQCSVEVGTIFRRYYFKLIISLLSGAIVQTNDLNILLVWNLSILCFILCAISEYE